MYTDLVSTICIQTVFNNEFVAENIFQYFGDKKSLLEINLYTYSLYQIKTRDIDVYISLVAFFLFYSILNKIFELCLTFFSPQILQIKTLLKKQKVSLSQIYNIV